MHTLLLSMLLFFSILSTAKADVYYCKGTASILLVLHEIEGRPIYTQKVDPYPKTLNFKRESNKITIKEKGGGESIMEIHSGVFPIKGTKDYFLASSDGKFGADGRFGMTGYFEYLDGLATYHMGTTISTFQCDKF